MYNVKTILSVKLCCALTILNGLASFFVLMRRDCVLALVWLATPFALRGRYHLRGCAAKILQSNQIATSNFEPMS